LITEISRDQKSRRSSLGNATRTGFSTASKSINSCPTASQIGDKKPSAAATIPTMLAAIPPSAALQGDSSHALTDVQQLIDFRQRCFQHHGVRRFRDDVVLRTEGHANSRCQQRGSIVDPVAHKQRFRLRGFFLHNGRFFFRTFPGVDLGDAHALCQVPDFRFTVTGNQHHLAHPVFRFQMLDGRGAVFARRIVEAERRGVSALHKHQALQAAHQFRQR
jgi:hypothetical protein